jgi:hypothetical protein
MSTAPQFAFDQNDQLVSSGVPPKYFQLFATLTSQATKKIKFRALIEGFVDSIGRAMHCDCAYIALLDPEDSHTFREFALQYPNRNRRVQQLPLISERNDNGYRELLGWANRSVLSVPNRSPAQSPA